MSRRLTFLEKQLFGILAVCALAILFLAGNLDARSTEVDMCRGLAPAVSEMIDRRQQIIALLDTLQADLRLIVATPADGQARQLAELVGEIRSGI